MEATEINTKLLERLSDYVDDKYTGDVLVISVFENIRFAEDRTELEKVLGPKAKKKVFIKDSHIENECFWNYPTVIKGAFFHEEVSHLFNRVKTQNR